MIKIQSASRSQMFLLLNQWSSGEGNGNPLQCSCLQNPRDGEAWSAAVYGVAQSQTRLKRLSSSSSDLTHNGGQKITSNSLRFGYIYIKETKENGSESVNA